MADQGPDETAAYARLQELLFSLSDLRAFLGELARLATEVVGGSASCGITVRIDGHPLTVGSSDDRAELLDETQYRLGGGPCLQAVETGQVVDSPDTESEERWPRYIETARREGLRCSLSTPVSMGSATLGALNVYGFEAPGAFSAAARRQLELFAAQAAGTLRVANRQIKDGQLLGQMEGALRSRTVIDQAMGIIMGQQRCAADVAFGLLRREARDSRRALREVAGDLVTRISGHEPQPGRAFDAG